MGTLRSDTLHQKDKPTRCNSQILFYKGHGMINVASSRLPIPSFKGRFFIAFLSTLILVICICRHYAKG